MVTARLSRLTVWVTMAIALSLPARTAWATSYLVVADGPTLVSTVLADGTKLPGGANPPCDKAATSTFSVTLQNNNGPILFCTEIANPIKLAKVLDLDPVAGVVATPDGSASFLGLKTTVNGALTTVPLNKEIQAGADKAFTFFFDVQTGPTDGPTGKCDFEEATITTVVCDGGGSCDFFPFNDPPYPLCESPAKYFPQIKIVADATSCPASSTGTGTISGTVSRTDGQPYANAKVEVKRGCRGSPGFVDQQQTTPRLPQSQRGKYAIKALPFPATYTVTVQADGLCATADVSIPSSGTISQDFVLANQCH